MHNLYTRAFLMMPVAEGIMQTGAGETNPDCQLENIPKRYIKIL